MKKKYAILSFAVLGVLLIVYVLFYKEGESENEPDIIPAEQLWGEWIRWDGAAIEFREDGRVIDDEHLGFEADSYDISGSRLVLNHDGSTHKFRMSDVRICGDHAFLFTIDDTAFIYIGDTDFTFDASDLTSHDWGIHGLNTVVRFGAEGTGTVDLLGSPTDASWRLEGTELTLNSTSGVIDHVARCRGKAMVMTFDDHGVAWMDVSLR